jgi:hypothetical protein
MRSATLQKLFEQVLKKEEEPVLSQSITSRQLQIMETAYAEALGDGADAETLSRLWQDIKRCKRRIEEYA